VGEYPEVIDTIIFGWMAMYIIIHYNNLQGRFLPSSKMLIVNKANPNAS